jgi:transketolase
MAELLAVLYRKILRLSPQTVADPDRDRFILSKGHSCAGAYAVLAECGFFPLEWLESFYHNGARLAGHITAAGIPGVEVSTGALGHGLSISCGLALAGLRDGRPYRVFTLLSDGECDEGSTWEAVLFAGHHRLENLTAIVDYNKIQSLGRCKDVLDLDPLGAKWAAFGWAVREIDGHDVAAVEAALAKLPQQPGKPSCVIAHTVKGKGVSFMEDKLLWHYRTPAGEEYQRALAELGGEP